MLLKDCTTAASIRGWLVLEGGLYLRKYTITPMIMKQSFCTKFESYTYVAQPCCCVHLHV